MSYRVILVVHCFLPFFLNDVIFPASYMPDQFQYQAAVSQVRNGEIAAVLDQSTVGVASLLLAIVPLPTVMTIQSLGFFNKFIYIIIFGFLYKRSFFTPLSALIFLLYPDAALYTGLSLRDPLIFIFMIMGCYSAINQKYLLFISCMIPLYFIKFQNFFILMPLLTAYMVLRLDRNDLSVRAIAIFISLSLVGLIVTYPIAEPMINYFRKEMYIENGGDGSDLDLIKGVGNFLVVGLTSGIYFLIKPLPWESDSAFQLIQSMQNLVVLFIIYRTTVIAWKKSSIRLFFWLFLLIMSMSIYGLVVFNYGTAARYRFPFVLVYLIIVIYEFDIKITEIIQSSLFRRCKLLFVLFSKKNIIPGKFFLKKD